MQKRINKREWEKVADDVALCCLLDGGNRSTRPRETFGQQTRKDEIVQKRGGTIRGEIIQQEMGNKKITKSNIKRPIKRARGQEMSESLDIYIQYIYGAAAAATTKHRLMPPCPSTVSVRARPSTLLLILVISVKTQEKRSEGDSLKSRFHLNSDFVFVVLSEKKERENVIESQKFRNKYIYSYILYIYGKGWKRNVERKRPFSLVKVD